MANQDHITALRQGPAELNHFRAANPGMVLDLSNAQLTDIDLTKRNLSGANLRGANMNGLRAQEADFSDADLTSAKLIGGNFRGAVFTRAILRNAEIRSVIMESTVLREADLSNAICAGTNFGSADFTSAITNGTSFTSASLAHAKISAVSICRAELKGADLSSVDLTDIDLSGRDLERTNFNNARIIGANFASAQLTDAQFGGARLESANFRNAVLTRANLNAADLTSANLVGAKLTRASCQATVLNKANIGGADFYEAILDRTSMEVVVGAYDAKNLLTTDIPREALYFPTVARSWPERWLDWERIRIAGRLPLLGVSYTGLIAIPIYVYLLGMYNDSVELVRIWISHIAGTPNSLLEHLHGRPVPSRFFILFLATMCLAAASTIYAVACPSRVKTFSRDQWCDELARSLVHYWPEAWKKRPLRCLCAVLYALGGAGALYALSGKLWRVAVILYHSPSPFG